MSYTQDITMTRMAGRGTAAETVLGKNGSGVHLNFLSNTSLMRNGISSGQFGPVSQVVTHRRPTVATRIGSTRLLVRDAINTLRFDHNPSTGTAIGALLEEGVTNVAFPSSSFSGWIKTASITLEANHSSAPDGTVTATRVTASPGEGSALFIGTVIANGTRPTTYSIYVKSGTKTVIPLLLRNHTTSSNLVSVQLNTTTGQLSGTNVAMARVESISNGWYRVALTATTGVSHNDTLYTYAGWTGGSNPSTAENFSIWGVQVEANGFASSYVATTTAPVTRASDSLVIPIGDWFNPSQGTVIFDIDPFSMVGYPTIFEFTNADRTSLMDLLLHPDLPGLYGRTIMPGVTRDLTVNSGQSLAHTRVKGAWAFSGEGQTLFLQGRPFVNRTNPMGNGFTTMRIFNGNGALSGRLRTMTYFPVRLTEAEISSKLA